MPGCLLQLVCSVEILHFVEGQQVCALCNHHVSSRLHPERPCMLVCCLEYE